MLHAPDVAALSVAARRLQATMGGGCRGQRRRAGAAEEASVLQGQYMNIEILIMREPLIDYDNFARACMYPSS